jgi:hypothetical protein
MMSFASASIRGMRSSRSCVLAILFLLGSFVGAAHAGAIAGGNHVLDGNHVRTTDAHMRAAITDGVERSAFFRDLVAQLDASDVIVYVQSDRAMPPRLQGRLVLLSVAGGRRYVLVRIACGLTGPEQIAILGHELQHAVEIANAESVVDEGSLAAEYRRIGFASGVLRPGAGYDSRAAIEAGRRVWHELTRRAE